MQGPLYSERLCLHVANSTYNSTHSTSVILSVPDKTYNVFSGTLNPTQSINPIPTLARQLLTLILMLTLTPTVTILTLLTLLTPLNHINPNRNSKKDETHLFLRISPPKPSRRRCIYKQTASGTITGQLLVLDESLYVLLTVS